MNNRNGGMILKNKKLYVIVIIVIMLLIGGIGIINFNKSNNFETHNGTSNSNEELKLLDNQVAFVKALVGLESKEMKIIDNPLRLEGSFIIPDKTLLNSIEYYLAKSKNTDIKDVEVSINKDGIEISGKYNLFAKFMTPVEITVVPSITKENDVKLDLKDIKVLKLKINNKIIDAIIESWFSNLQGIRIDNGDVVIDKSNFKGVTVKSLSIESSNFVIGISIKLD